MATKSRRARAAPARPAGDAVAAAFADLDVPSDHPSLEALRRFLAGVADPAAVLAEIGRVRSWDDPLVAPGARFLERPANPHFETWDHPVNLRTLIEVEAGRLLALPPGTRRFHEIRRLAPTIVEMQLVAVYPRLTPEVANRPNLFFPGVFFPHEIAIRNMEMISARHGTYYVSEVLLDLAGEAEPAAVVAKPADMGVEAIVTHTLRDLNRRMTPAVREGVGPIAVPTTVSVGGKYGIMERVPGQNGVEFLGGHVATGGIVEFDRREYPADLDLTRDETISLAREFAKQAVMAYYLRLYDRKPDQMMIRRDADGRLQVTHIDFGRGLKRNYALPWKRHYDPGRPALDFRDHEVPYFEAAAALIYVPHFIPARFRGDLDPWAGEMREAIVETFVAWANELKRNAETVVEWYGYLVGERTQYREHEVADVRVTAEDVAAVRDALLALDDPRRVVDSILGLARHERRGTTPVEWVGEADAADAVYRRSLESGPRATRLVPACEGDSPYRLEDFRAAGAVRYDADEKVLVVEFGGAPDRVIDQVAGRYSRRLARWIRAQEGPKKGVRAEVRADGALTVYAGGGALVRRGLRVPPEVVREVTGTVSGTVPPPHVADLAAAYHEWKRERPEADTLRREVEKASLVMANDLAGREVLQFYMAQEEEDSPLRPALAEMIGFLVSNADFLVDKDPFDTINQYVVSLGRKHGFVRPLRPDFFPGPLRAEPAFLGAVLALYAGEGEAETTRRALAPHHVHLAILVRFAWEIARRADLPPAEVRRLLAAALLHDLSVLRADFRAVVTEPCGRSWARYWEDRLERHAEAAVAVLDEVRGRIPLPAGLAYDDLRTLVLRHHDAGGDVAAEVLHLADNVAVFGDQTRPDNWIRGAYRMADVAPRWIDAQRERGLVSEAVHRAARAYLADPATAPRLRELDDLSAPYLKAHNALHLAALLRNGLHPHHPGLLEELRARHGRERVDRIWSTVLRSNMTVREKVAIIYRVYDIAPLFEAEGIESYAFVNASARPVQRTVELIERLAGEGRTVILVGFFPRVLKTFERIGDRRLADRVHAIAGTKRLQFIRYSYPHEADLEVPIHRAIEAWRAERGVRTRACLIPLRRLFEARTAEAEGEARYRALGKAGAETDADAVDEAIEAEAVRFRAWATSAPPSLDAPERERFRRILLNGYSNRDVLAFTRLALPADSPVAAPLREVAAALHENPNYLADRTHYYALHELTRSLSLIHFPYATRPAIEARCEALDLDGEVRRLLAVPKAEMTFALHAFVSAVEIARFLAAAWEAEGGGALRAARRARIEQWVAAASAVAEDPVVGEYLLSPEDLATNATLRAALLHDVGPLGDRIAARAGGDLEGEADRTIAQTALLLASYADASRIENWRRAKIEIAAEDVREVGTSWVATLGPALGSSARATLERLLGRLAGREGLALLNRLAAAGADHVVLYNALTVAAELRYGLSPRGLDVVQHVREVHGTRLADALVEGIVGAEMPPRDKVKCARKLRMWADALAPEADDFDEVRFLNADSIAALSRAAEVRAAIGGRTVYILTGSHEKAAVLFERVAAGLGAADRRALARCLRVLVGEDYPVLMKEKTVLLTEAIEAHVRAHRAAVGSTRRVLLVPAETVLDLPAEARALLPRPDGREPPDDPALRFLRAWVRRFD